MFTQDKDMPQKMERPLLWLDCEMTGLDPFKDRILEVACILTDGCLQGMKEGPCFVLHCPKEQLDQMDAWCQEQHKNSGLIEACLKSQLSASEAEREIIGFLKQNNVGEREAALAGNSIHMDKEFLRREMPRLINYLHYQIVDVSSIKLLAQRWYPDIPPPKKLYHHRALEDIKESIQELDFYRKKIFK